VGSSASGPCPYFLSREMAATADIIFMPVSQPFFGAQHVCEDRLCLVGTHATACRAE